jgi:hypothetical protein
MTTKATITLARDRIRLRRLELALSERDVASHWGVSTAVVRSVEAGRVDTELTLGQLAKLADILGLDLHELLDTGNTTPATSEAGADTLSAEDVAKVGALLADVRVLVPIDTLAEVLGWDLERTHDALAVLDERLRPAGLRVHRLHHDVRLARTVTATSDTELEALWRRHFAVRSLHPAQANLLRQIRDGKTRLAGTKDTEKVRLPELRNAGLIYPAAAQVGTTARWELTDDVRFSLLVDDLPTTNDVAAPPRPPHHPAFRSNR